MSETSVTNSTITSTQRTKPTVDNDFKGPITWDDATWILTSAFIIFTMQSGFGMLEAGAVASKNTVNIMVKNVVDVVFGGMTYWMFGYALSFGEGKYSNPFCGFGDFFVDTNSEDMGLVYATFVFQLSFATTATTIVSGAMAERTNLTAYIVFSFFNTVVYCIPAHWVWSAQGFLAQLGVVGSGVVHLVGACSGLVATLMLKPRIGRYTPGEQWPALVNPVNAIIGTFMLWWGWLAFNCGSTFGISGGKWVLASKAAFTTLIASMSGGITGVGVSLAENYDMWGRMKRCLRISPSTRLSDQRPVASFLAKRGKYDVTYLINSILGSLVAITASCPLVRPYEGVIIGTVGALCTLGWAEVMDKLKVDDPVSAVAVHGASGAWGLVAVGLFVEDDNLEDLTGDRNGLLKGGGLYLLGVQLLAIVCEVVWSVVITYLLLLVIDKTMGLRVSAEEERLGADYCEHGVIDTTLCLPVQPRLTSPAPSTAFHNSTASLVISVSPKPGNRELNRARAGEGEDGGGRRRRFSSITSLESIAHDGGDPACRRPTEVRNGVKDKLRGVKVRKNGVKVMTNGVEVCEKGLNSNEIVVVKEMRGVNGGFAMGWGEDGRNGHREPPDDILPNSVLPM